MENTNASANMIQKWWKSHTQIGCLRKVFNHLSSSLTIDDLYELSNKCRAITDACKGDGGGLSGGMFIDMFLCKYFKEKIPQYSEHHIGESDMKICDIHLSQKKINGKSTIALDWSKNENKSSREHFNCSIIIINLKTEKWWKKNQFKSLLKLKLHIMI